jgi:dephospho-CoA kinase
MPEISPAQPHQGGDLPKFEEVPIPLPKEAYVIGLLGGIGSGKSRVAWELERLGAGVLDADKASHRVLESPEVRKAIEQKWGQRVLDPKGYVSRQAVAEVVFRDDPAAEEERRFLERLIHPEVSKLLATEAERLVASGKSALVLDAPLLAEVGWHKSCHLLVFVEASEETRFGRLQARGWTWEEFRRRQGAQWPVTVKRRLAHEVISNESSPEELAAQVAQLWHRRIAPNLGFHGR